MMDAEERALQQLTNEQLMRGVRLDEFVRVGQRSPADAETGRPDRAPPNPTKMAGQRMLTNLEFAMDRWATGQIATTSPPAARMTSSVIHAVFPVEDLD